MSLLTVKWNGFAELDRDFELLHLRAWLRLAGAIEEAGAEVEKGVRDAHLGNPVGIVSGDLLKSIKKVLRRGKFHYERGVGTTVHYAIYHELRYRHWREELFEQTTFLDAVINREVNSLLRPY